MGKSSEYARRFASTVCQKMAYGLTTVRSGVRAMHLAIMGVALAPCMGGL